MSIMNRVFWVVLIVAGLIAPHFVYPVFAMKLLCFALFACAFNLLLGYVGLLSFGHAAFFGGAAYITGHVITAWGFAPLPAGLEHMYIYMKDDILNTKSIANGN